MKNSVLILLVLLFVFSCKPDGKKGEQLFTSLPSSSTQVDFKNKLTETEQSNIIEYLYFNNGAGVAAGDINNDGLVDLYFTSNQGPNKLYLNKGNMKFEDITESAGVAGSGDWKTGVAMADVNGDGFLDIYVCQVGKYKNLHGKNQLFINQGNNTFKDEAHDYGLDFQGFSTQAAFFDYDGDGDLDMYLLNHSVHTSRSFGDVSLRYDHDSLAGDRLYRNDLVDGKIIFHDVTQDAGIYNSQIGYGLGINVCDINNDGYPDIYISNDFHENDYLYINNKNGTFSEHLTDFIGHTSRSSMGNDIGDINNDGLLDIIVLDMLPDKEKIRKQSGGENDYELFMLKRKNGYNYQFVRNTLQLNLGGDMFSEIGQLAGVSSTDWSWSPLLCDVDNDGWKDLFITNGIYRRANDLDYVKFLTGGNRSLPPKDNSAFTDKELYEKMPLYPNISYIFKNNGDLTFSNMAKAWGINTRAFSNGSTYADLDNDGDLDLIVNNINGPAFLYRNNETTKSGNHYLSVVLRGKGMNTRGIGARVTIFCGGQRQTDEQFPTRGFLSATSDILHFGLGTMTKIDSLIVRWPDLSEQMIKDVAADQTLTLDVANALKKERIVHKDDEKTKFFSPVSIPGLVFKHKEDEWVDFYRERLIPHSLSAEGPSLSVADIDGDGLQDIFVGGAKRQKSEIFQQQKDGSFKSLKIPLLQDEYSLDVIDAAFFDADGDGDKDIIVTGELLNVCIFKNDKGYFTYFTEYSGLGETTGWWNCLRVADVNGDGLPDIIAGNLGLNSLLKASVKEPVEMYLNDFDNNGSLDQVICSYQNGISYPVASLDELSGQIAGLEKKYPHYSDFGGKTVYDIFGKKAIDQSILKKAVLFESCLFHNNGDGTFKISKLPIEAQFSQVRDILVRDINKDGNTDLVLAGNNYAVRPSYGRYDASFGWCLLGDTSHTFKTLMPVKSGLKITGDARRIVPMDISGKHYILAAVNNGDLQIFQFLK